MTSVPADCLALGRQLEQLLADIKATDTKKGWDDVTATAQNLANALRTKDPQGDPHTKLGKTHLPQTLTSLLSLALHGSPIPDLTYAPVLCELLRVSANLCMDHDENRSQLLEAGFPQAIVSLLEGYADPIPPPPYQEPLSLAVVHLQVVRTAIGMLLNACLGFDPVKYRLISLEAALTVVRLSAAIYPPGVWVASSVKKIYGQSADVKEIWSIRSRLSDWAWRLVSELKDVKDESLQVLNPDVLPLLIPPLQIFTTLDAISTPSSNELDPELSLMLLHADFESLEESCMLIESLSLDNEDVRLSLARGLYFPVEHRDVPCLASMLDFIEKGTYPLLWRGSLDEAELKRRERAFDICKGAIIKAVVEVTGQEHNEDVLWDESENSKPGGEFVYRMVEWVKKYVNTKDSTTQDASVVDRDDLVICATLSLGNLTRREKYATSLLSPPHNLAPALASKHLLSPTTDIKLKHGVIGLLKHLAQYALQSSQINESLQEAHIVEHIIDCDIWDEKADAMAQVVQISAIGVVKHLCNASVDNTFSLVLPSTTESSITGLDQILALVKRSDSVAIKSEGTRVLVNVIKSLWSDINQTKTPNAGEETVTRNERRQKAMGLVIIPQCASALANLVSRSGRYPLLVNEGIVALSLLATQKVGGPLVLDAITAPASLEAVPASSISTPSNSDVSSPVTTSSSNQQRQSSPRHTRDMLKAVLKNVDNPANFPVEIRLNVCSLLIQINKNCEGEELAKFKAALQPTLQKLAESLQGSQGKEEMLYKSVKKVLDNWA